MTRPIPTRDDWLIRRRRAVRRGYLFVGLAVVNTCLLALGLGVGSWLLIVTSAVALGLAIGGRAISAQTVEIIDVAIHLNAHL